MTVSDSLTTAANKLLLNKYLSELMTKWKESMKEQVDDFQKIAVEIRKNESELIKNHTLVPYALPPDREHEPGPSERQRRVQEP